MVCSLQKCSIWNDVIPRLQNFWNEDYWVLVIGLKQCCAGIWIFKEAPIPSFLIASKSENRWTFWFFENKRSESKNCELQVVLKPERTCGFHERTANKVAISWLVWFFNKIWELWLYAKIGCCCQCIHPQGCLPLCRYPFYSVVTFHALFIFETASLHRTGDLLFL